MLAQSPHKTNAKQPLTVRIAVWSARFRWPVVALWFVFTIGLFALSMALGGAKTGDMSNPGSGDAKTEAAKATQVYNAGATQTSSQDLYLVVTNPNLKASDPAYKAAVAKMEQSLQSILYTENGQSLPVFSRIVDPYSVPPGAGLISPDGTTVRIVATIPGTSKEVGKKIEPVKTVIANLKAQNSGYELNAFNNYWLNDDINQVVSKDLDGSLKITIPLTFAILLVAFGAVVAAVVPLVLGITALLAAFGILGIYSQLISPVSSYANQLIVLIGLAVAVDYSLFMVTRYRSERRRGRDKLAAIEIASSTAGRAVFFSGLTVMISLGGLFLLDDSLFHSMAIGTIAVVLVSVLGSLTFLPAVMAILGKGLNWGRIPFFGRDREEGSGFWSKLVSVVMRRPVVMMVVSAAVMLALAFPMLHLRMGLTDIDSFPDNIEGVRTLKVMNQKWPQGTTLKASVVITNANKPETAAAIEQFKSAVLKVPGFSQPVDQTISGNGTVARVNFTMGGSMNDQSNQDLIKKLRSELVPASFKNLNGVNVYVGGDAAYALDNVKTYTDAMPLIFGFVLGLSFLLLLVAFHSIVIPVKAILLNLLSTGASYGAMVLVFQDGWFGSALGIKTTEVIESWVPVFIFTILFGLSMDYHLFILTRIKEAKDKGATSNEAVAKGISITSGTITSAASIMVMVFAVFVTMQLVIIRQLGLGLAVAVFLDATVIRCVLLPATMRLLGDWNWYMPKFLDWIPRVTIEAEEPEEAEEEPELLAAAS
ncbi:MAG TPA: MMPL family transporter [Chloroflexia bacterium]|nr:MMPL family transporter [Chloroflexia bacterium]